MSDTLTKPKIKVDADIKKQVKEQEELEQQVIVHCTLHAPASMTMGVRIWQSTFLFDKESSHKSKLLHQENIPLAPSWKDIAPGAKFTFTLFFSPLPKSCTEFHLREVIPVSGGFEVQNIKRNHMDVYRVRIPNY